MLTFSASNCHFKVGKTIPFYFHRNYRKSFKHPRKHRNVTSVTSPQYSPSACSTIGLLIRSTNSQEFTMENPLILSCFAAIKSGRQKNVFHFGIPDALLKDNKPSVGTAWGAIGTPPPSARRFIAAAKITFSSSHLQVDSCSPSLYESVIFAVSMVKRDCIVWNT